MNLPSFILLMVILGITVIAVIKIIRSKGACEDCNVTSCPIKDVGQLSENHPNCCD